MSDMWAWYAYDLAKQQERLTDLNGKAAYVAKKTGQEPISFYEFKQNTPEENKNTRTIAGTMLTMSFGAFMGLVVGGMVAMMFPAVMTAALVIGGVGGALAGSVITFSGDERGQLLDKYENYLTQFEQSVGRGQTLDIAYRNDHAKQLADRRTFEKGVMMGAIGGGS